MAWIINHYIIDAKAVCNKKVLMDQRISAYMERKKIKKRKNWEKRWLGHVGWTRARPMSACLCPMAVQSVQRLVSRKGKFACLTRPWSLRINRGLQKATSVYFLHVFSGNWAIRNDKKMMGLDWPLTCAAYLGCMPTHGLFLGART